MPSPSLHDLLASSGFDYQLLHHEPAKSVELLSQQTGVEPSMLAQTIVIHVDGVSALAVTTASHTICWDRLCRVMGTDFIDLADESEFAQRFPDCEPGAIPPFGSLFRMTVYLDQSLAVHPTIAFAACNHTETIVMAMEDYRKLVKPIILAGGFVSADQFHDPGGPLVQRA